MNRIDLYAAFISEQVYMDEIFGDRDRGYPYHKRDFKQTRDSDHEYEVDLPDNALPATVSIYRSSATKMGIVNFDMPTDGYGISPEAKQTYKTVYQHHINQGKAHQRDAFDAHKHAVAAVGSSHGQEEAEKADKSWDVSYMAGMGSKHHAYRMMATVGKILHEHGKNNPQIKHFKFQSSGDKDSRDKLYHAIAKKHGGEKHYDENEDEHFYTIPNPHYSGD